VYVRRTGTLLTDTLTISPKIGMSAYAGKSEARSCQRSVRDRSDPDVHGGMAWFHYSHGRSPLISCIGFATLAASCWLLWREWKPAYLLLCAATGLGALISFVVDGRSNLGVFAVGMNGFALVNLMLPVTRSFLNEQRSKYRRASAGSGIGG
jgi:hypothetical protein